MFYSEVQTSLFLRLLFCMVYMPYSIMDWNLQKSVGLIIWKGWRKMKSLKQVKDEQMKDPSFVKEYEAIQPEMDVIRAIIDARTSQKMTQKELAERTGINQADISKLENGTRNPSVNLLKRLADGMGMALKIEFVPKQDMMDI